MTEWSRKGLLILVSVGFTAVLAEVGLRLLEKVDLCGSPGDAGEQGLMERQPGDQWIPQRGLRQQRTDPYGQDFVLRINSTGQRGEEVGFRRLNERRILFLGDSFTMGSDLREEDIFVTKVGRMLQSKSSEPVLTLNGGVNGYNTSHELVYYQYYGRDLDPDVVVLCFFHGQRLPRERCPFGQGSLTQSRFHACRGTREIPTCTRPLLAG